MTTTKTVLIGIGLPERTIDNGQGSASRSSGAEYRAPARCSAANFSTLRRARKRRW